MKTLSPTKARQNLTSLLQRAKRGEDIGILHNGDVYVIRLGRVYSEDYALLEYGASERQMERVDRKAVQRAQKKGKVWDGTAHGLRG